MNLAVIQARLNRTWTMPFLAIVSAFVVAAGVAIVAAVFLPS
jgi:hypothetical protein